MHRGFALGVGLAGVALGVIPRPGAAQQRPVEQVYTADGLRLDYPPNGVWPAGGYALRVTK